MSRYNVAIFHVWETKAEEDEASAQLLLEHGGPPSRVCFLLKDCLGLEDSFRDLTEDLKRLTGYYIASRYPDDLPEDVSPQEAAVAFEAASRVRKKTLECANQILKTLGLSSEHPSAGL